MSETPSSSGDEEIEAITSEILAALQTKDFFGRLEAKLWPHGPDEVSVCCHNLSYSRELLSDTLLRMTKTIFSLSSVLGEDIAIAK